MDMQHVHAHDDVTVSGTQHVDPQRYRPLLVEPGKPQGRTFKAEV
jgi:hypothetical protein